jgi:hypothetical protein
MTSKFVEGPAARDAANSDKMPEIWQFMHVFNSLVDAFDYYLWL